MDLRLLTKTIKKTASSIWSDRIMNAVLKGVAIYISLSFVFGFLYYFFDSLDFKSASGNNVHFLDYLYFSAVTFTTIGYGDIIPNSVAGQVIVLIESCFEMIFFPVFGGFIAYKFMQRPNDILLTDNFFIRYRNERIYLSSRVGNKGKNLIDCTATVEFIQLADNVKRTLYKREFNTPIIELTWYLEVRLDGEENTTTLQQFKTLLANPGTSMIRTTVSGYDSSSGNMVHVFKRYTMDKLLYGGKFSDVYIWEGVKRTKPDWTNFNKVVPLTSTEQRLITNLLQS
jgi:hypothetical protein